MDIYLRAYCSGVRRAEQQNPRPPRRQVRFHLSPPRDVVITKKKAMDEFYRISPVPYTTIRRRKYSPAFHSLHNHNLDRYDDIKPYESNMVGCGVDKLGYINASKISVPIPDEKNPLVYIATQGPKENTCIDFWDMVWQEESTLIVMLCKVNPNTCYKYWPEDGTSQQYGAIEVCSDTVITQRDTSTIIHTLELKKTGEANPRRVEHIQYVSWPDHDVPQDDDIPSLQRIIVDIQTHRQYNTKPPIIHCSAGVGRTGVAIMLECIKKCLDLKIIPNLPQILADMRLGRPCMIQTPSQYWLCYRVLIRDFPLFLWGNP